MGGKAYAVYDPRNEREFEQTCELVERSRVHNNGPSDYRPNSPTAIWMKQKTREILRAMIKKRQDELSKRAGSPPKHLTETEEDPEDYDSGQATLWK
jgi:tRNA A37 methylthiotransferase MiaB